jgi:hypothetical protein
MDYKTGCFICGEKLIYICEEQEATCDVCNNKLVSNTFCSEGHFVCNECHISNSIDFIKTACISGNSKNPFKLMNHLLQSPKVKMHGPDHHFLIPAVLITCYYNYKNEQSSIPAKLEIAETRSRNILGGFCGFYGNCGAAVGTGIFMAIITGSTPYKYREWSLSNMITADSLKAMAKQGGPRCCKRNSFLAVIEAMNFLEKEFNVYLEREEISCLFNQYNKECQLNDCPFF